MLGTRSGRREVIASAIGHIQGAGELLDVERIELTEVVKAGDDGVWIALVDFVLFRVDFVIVVLVKGEPKLEAGLMI